MALNKETNYKGITANYWTIVRLSLNRFDETTHVTISLYLNEATRRSGLDNDLISQTYGFKGLLDMDQVYSELKLLEDFKDATDC